MAKPDDKTYKNRHINRKKNDESNYEFPNTDNCLKQFCTVEEILYEFKPLRKKEEKE